MKKSVVLLLFIAGITLAICTYLYVTNTNNGPVDVITPTSEETVSAQSDTTPGDTDTTVSTSSADVQPAGESITVSSDSLSDGQKQLLETFGVDTENIVITPTMITCAEEKVGQERLVEIQAGDTPSFLEGISLASCYK